MLSSWWLWMAFMFFLLVPPLGYGWGYRGWGPPYPRYIQRRRGQQAAATGGPANFNHHSWGWAGDFVWMVLFIGLFWTVSLFFWNR
jgi:hypothetical protein